MGYVFIPIRFVLPPTYIVYQGILVQDRSGYFYSEGRQSVLGNRQYATQGYAAFDYHERRGEVRCESCR